MAGHKANIPVFQPLPKRFRGIPMPESNNVDSLWETVEALKEVVEVLIGERGGGELSALLHRDYNPPVEEEEPENVEEGPENVENQEFLGLGVNNGAQVNLTLPGGSDFYQMTFPNMEIDTAGSWEQDVPNGYTVAVSGYYLVDVMLAVTDLSMGGGNTDFEFILVVQADGVDELTATRSLGSRDLDSEAIRNVIDIIGILYLSEGMVITTGVTNTSSQGLNLDREGSFLRICWLGKRPETVGVGGISSVNQDAMTKGFSEGFTI